MKLFLTSHNLEQKHLNKFQELIGGPKISKALFITAAAVPYGLNPKPSWLTESQDDLSPFAENIDETTLEDDSLMPDDLSQYGFVFVSGGNTFYLAYRLAKTGFDKKIKDYVKNDGVFVGSSAGAIILMDDIEPFAPLDDPSQAPKTYPGLGLVNFAILPHADSEKYGPLVHKLADEYQDHEAFLLNDNQVIVVDGNHQETI